jgi:hypothetical protein
MRSVLITLIGVVTLLATLYTVHTFGDAKLRAKLSIPASASIRDVGTVEFLADTPTVFHLGRDKDMTVTASIITNEAFLATNRAVLLSGPHPITNDMFQISVSYTSRTERLVHTEQQFFTGLQDKQVAIRLASESDNPVAVVMTPRLMPK